MRARNCAALALTIVLLAGHGAAKGAPVGIKQAKPVTIAPRAVALRFLPDVRGINTRFGFRKCASRDTESTGDPERCRVDGCSGSVFARDGVELLDRFDARGARVVARLHGHQFVCMGIDAGRESGMAASDYAIAVPTCDVPECRSERACPNADPPGYWAGPAPATPCGLPSDGRYSAGCATGWVRTANLDRYSNGIRPVDGRFTEAARLSMRHATARVSVEDT